MRIYCINLARRPDRMAAMTAAAGALGLELSRIEAVDAAAAGPALEGWFQPRGPLGEIPRGDKACFLSHRLAWQALLESGENHAAVLEDDVRLSGSAGTLLGGADWTPPDAGLIKLEHYGPAHQRILVGEMRSATDGFRLARLMSRHTGAAAYILSRKVAEKLLALERANLPVDHLLFNPNNSPLFEDLRPWQLIPAIARQEGSVGEKSDIETSRTPLRRLTPTYVRRELVRFGYDLKLLPRQVGEVLSGKAKFIAIAAAP
jgi:glycosyl transferase family 25